MKKKSYLLAFVILCSICFIKGVFAYSNTTGKVWVPGLTPGSVNSTTIYNLTTNHSSHTVTGARTVVYYSDFQPLATRYVSDSSRKLIIKLYEDDEYPNSDDLVKTYTWTFKGRELDEVTVNTNDSGNIDSSGDPTAELYLTFYLQKNVADSLSATNQFFKYQITVN